MKNLMAMAYMVVCVFVLCSCKKENQIEKGTPSEIIVSEDVSIKDDRFVFSTVDSYENFISERKGDNSNGKSRTTSLDKSSQDTLIDDPFLQSILDEKNMIQIGGKIYLLDFSTETCYVLENADDNISLLEHKDIASGKVKAYPFDVEVLHLEDIEDEYAYLVDGGTPSDNAKKKAKCKDKGAKRRKDTNGDPKIHNIYLCSDVCSYGVANPDAKLVYQKAAIYFSLITKFKYSFRRYNDLNFFTSESTDIVVDISYKFKPKCKPEESYIYPTFDLNCQDKGLFAERAYESTRALNKYEMTVFYQWSQSGCYDNTSGYANTFLSISNGY